MPVSCRRSLLVANSLHGRLSPAQLQTLRRPGLANVWWCGRPLAREISRRTGTLEAFSMHTDSRHVKRYPQLTHYH